MTKRVLSAAFALALTLGTSACGGGTDSAGSTTSSSTPTGSASTTTDHNAVDVMFVTMMIPHHEGAIEMSDLALAQASSPPVRDLAGRIKAAQGPEIEQMQGWLADWDATMPMASGTAGDGHDMGPGMMSGSLTSAGADDFGMGAMMQMSEADLAALRAATGVQFDKLFLEQMIAHHEGAIAMAEVEIARGLNPATLALAESIRTSQAVEITEMQQLLSTI